ncbi:hypothetical protein C483_16393 [Natrialba hulunbeirensis JCM 10989]|uniref:Glycosyltransferase RgtA/B/C/D-like domain-containing protein n=1 Tax=Natrialba hulunbeirensis JCM 10989 TaxID=1227493 RepID=L9ZNG3_9EURY|nr:hypothetical protein [Natrialba hulunbeirensis]ELY87904.1 hypothetical protein C483_16393 [Natrialba hulunbeirensis JCM 10989]
MNRSVLNTTFAGGFLALAVGLVIARANPATGYEPSIFAGTPTATWIGFAIALAIAVVLALVCRGRQQGVAIALGATTVTAIVSLPLIRDYRFSGMGDALTHLGWTRDIVDGGLQPHELFYPGVHSIATVIHFLAGIPIERALLLSVVILFIPFLVFVPLVVRDMTGNGLAVGVAAIVSWMVLPINNIATHMGVHTNSNALFLVPVVIFAFVAYLHRRSTIEQLPFGLSPFSLLIYFSGIVLLLVHPQQMINVVVLVGTVAGLQYLARWRYEDHPVVEHPTTYTHAVVLGAIFTLWAVTNERFQSAVSGLVYGMFSADIGGGETVDQRGGSLTEIGGSLGEMFVLLFLDAAVIGLAAGLFVLVMWLGWTTTDRDTSTLVTYFALALVPLGGIFLVYFVGTPTMAFRQVGFIYVLLTILGAIAIAHAIGGLSRYITMPGSNAIAAVALGACLVLGLMTVYASPIIYNPGQHVTDQKFSGYETAFDHGAEDRPHVGLGYDPFRYDHGLYGLERDAPLSGAGTASGEVDPELWEAGNYTGAYNDLDYYFIVTEYDVTREVDVYQELHYSEAALEDASQQPGVNKVISNSEFEMYAVDASGGSDAPA